MDNSNLGLVQVFWGNGKGKTTCALGIALRACGNGYNVYLIQFMKNGASGLKEQVSGEIKSLQMFDNFSYKRFGVGEWILDNPTENQINSCKDALNYVSKILNDEKSDIIIVDEILYAVQMGLLSEDEVIGLINNKPKNKELILTGSHLPLNKIFEKADLISEIKKIKHPYDSGIMARKGIEY